MAIEALKINMDDQVEWIIVDNNSTPSLAELNLPLSLNRQLVVKIVNEKESGLTYARKKGIHTAKGDWVIFFDDDNDPSSDYLSVCAGLIKKYPEVGIWGAGKINVKFSGNSIHPWIDSKRPVFQERSIADIHISAERKWQHWYPVGTGMIANKRVLADYIEQLENGSYSATDRQGNSLTSGGDVQIVLHALKIGKAVGSTPSLSLRHWITKKKASTQYLLKHAYWVRSSNLLAISQVFPDRLVGFSKVLNRKLFLIAYSVFRIYLMKKGIREVLYRISLRFGDFNALFIAYPRERKPWILSWWEKRIA